MIVVYFTISAIFWGSLVAFLFLKREAVDMLINILVTAFACLIINAMVYSKFMEQLPLWLYFMEALFAMFAFVFYFVFEIRVLFPTYESEYFLLKMGWYMLNSILIVIVGAVFFKRTFAGGKAHVDPNGPTSPDEHGR
jgi:hypothetical protein